MSRLITANTADRNTKNLDFPSLGTANTANRFLTSVMTVRNPGESEILKGNPRFQGLCGHGLPILPKERLKLLSAVLAASYPVFAQIL